MSIKATIGKPNSIEVNYSSTVKTQTINFPVSLRNNGASLGSATINSTQAPTVLKNNGAGLNQVAIHNLLDVVEDHPADGSTLVYQASTGKYVVEPLTVSVNSLDGGTF
jgi:hypothetical protein